MPVVDALTQALRAAPELNTAPSVALGIAQSSAQDPNADPAGTAQAVGYTGNQAAQQQAFDQQGQKVGHPNLLHQALGWVGRGLHDVTSLPVVSQALHIANAPIQQIQHAYRYEHDVEARHGPIAALLEGVGIAAGAGLGAWAGGSEGAVLGGEAAALIEGQVAYRDSWARTTSGADYQGHYDRQTGEYSGPAGDVSVGRDLASGLKYGSKPQTLTSGITDGLADLFLDPLAAAGKLSSLSRSAEGAGGLIGTARSLAPQGDSLAIRASDLETRVANLPSVDRAFGDIAGMTSPTQIANAYPKFAPLAVQLADAGSKDAVTDVFRNALMAKEMTTEVLPSMSFTRVPFAQVSRAIRSYDGTGSGMIRSVTSLLPTYFDPETLSLSNKEFNLGDPGAIRGVYNVMRFSQSDEVARSVADEFARAADDPGKQLLIYKNGIRSMLVAKGLPEDSPFVTAAVDEIGQRAMGGGEAVYGVDQTGRNLSKVETANGSSSLAILAGQQGKLAFPDFSAVTREARNLSTFKSYYGAADDWMYNKFTQGIFKKLVLLSGGFAERIAAAEAIPAALREGVTNLVKSRLAASAAKGMGDEELGHLAEAVSKVSGGANAVLGDADKTGFVANLIADNGGHVVAPAIDTTTPSAEVGSRVERVNRTIYNAYGQVPDRMKLGDKFGVFGKSDGQYMDAWQRWMSQVSNDPASQQAAAAYLDAMRNQVTETATVAPDAIPGAAYYHGTSRAFPNNQLEHRYFQGAGAHNLFGPGVYVTDDPAVALSYTGKGASTERSAFQQNVDRAIQLRDSGDPRFKDFVPPDSYRPPQDLSKTVYGIDPTKQLNLIDLERPLPADAKQIFAQHVDSSLGADHLDITQETHDRIQHLLNDPAATGSEVYRAIKQGWAEAGLPKYEVDEALNNLHDNLQSVGYDGFRYQGGAYAAARRGTLHNAYVIFEPDSLRISHATPTESTITRSVTPEEATAAGVAAAKAHWDAQPNNVVGRFGRHTATPPGAEGVDPHQLWGEAIMENVKGATHAPLDMGGAPHVPLLKNIADGVPTTAEALSAIPDELRPVNVMGRQLLPDTTPLLDRIANVGFRKVLDPVINFISREPLYVNEAYRQYSYLKPLVDSGDMLAADARQLAQVRAVNGVLPFIHNTLERSQFSTLARNYMPFWFAQEQAYKRVGRLFADDPGAFRRFQLMISWMHEVGSTTTDPNGKSWLIYPGSGYLAEKAANLASALHIPIAGSVPVAFSGQLKSLNTVFPFSEGVRPSFGPVVAIPSHVLENLFPELTPAVHAAIGDQAASGSVYDQLIPNQFIKSTIQALDPSMRSRSMQNAVINTLQYMAYHQQQAMDKWTAAGGSPTDPGAPRIPGASPDDSALDRQALIDKVKNQTRITFMFKALLGAVTPASPVTNVGDWNLRADLRDLIAKKGITAAIPEFLANNPGATPYTVAMSSSQAGAPLPTTNAGQAWINENLSFIRQHPNAGAWFVPQTAGQFSQGVYNEQLAQHLRTHKAPDQALNDMYIAAGNDRFYNQDLPAYKAELAKAQQAGDKNLENAVRSDFSSYITNVLGPQNPVWWDDFKSADRDHNRQLAVKQMLDIFSSGKAPASPQTADLASLVQDFQGYAGAKTMAARDPNVTAAQVKDDWQSYLTRLSVEKPNLAPVIRSVFMQL